MAIAGQASDRVARVCGPETVSSCGGSSSVGVRRISCCSSPQGSRTAVYDLVPATSEGRLQKVRSPALAMVEGGCCGSSGKQLQRFRI